MKRLMIVLALATGVAHAASFEQARPVWPTASDGFPNENVRFAASFEADGRPLVLKATGATQYKIRLDGETIGWGPARAPEGWARVSEIPLEVAKGRHELAFEVMGYNITQLYCNIPQPAYLQAELVDADGKVLAATGRDGAFKATLISARHRKTVRFSSQRGFVECWTLPEKDEKALTLAERPAKRLTVRRAPEPDLSVKWPLKAVGEVPVRHDPDADAKQWEYVVETSADPSNGYPVAEQVWDACRKSQQFVALEEMRPVLDESKLRLKAGTRLRFDGGIEKTGFVRMKVKVAKPGKLWLNWSELLVWGKVNAFKMRNADISVWEFSEPGEYEIETLEPYALRYLEATAESGEFALSKVSVRLLESPEAVVTKLPRTGDAELDEVFAAARNTLAQNTLDTFMDCPGRERAAWLCDSFFSAKGYYALTGSTKVEKDFLENWLLPDSFGDLPEGMLPMTYPSSATSGEFIPNWAMWYVLQLEDYLKRSSDRAFVDAMKSRMERLIRFFRQYRNADGLLEKLPSWVFIEWSAANCYVQDVNYPANMTWAGVLEAYGRMYGDAEAKAEAAKVRKTIFEQSFNGRFFRDHAKRWADGSLTVMPECTETCQDYALFFRFGDKATAGNWYVTVVNKLGGARPYDSDILPEISKSAPFIGDALRLLALAELGETEILKRDLKAFYLAQAQRTGTLWETQMDINSNCHGFAGVVADVMQRLNGETTPLSERLEEKIDSARRRFEDWKGGDETVVFAVITDLHDWRPDLTEGDLVEQPKAHVAYALQVAQRFSADFVTDLGDIGSDHVVEDGRVREASREEMLRRWRSQFELYSKSEVPVFCCVGNHDLRYWDEGRWKSRTPEDFGRFFSPLARGADVVWGERRDYGYWDVPGKRCRVIVINTQDGDGGGVSRSQLLFLAHALCVPEGYTVVAVMHVALQWAFSCWTASGVMDYRNVCKDSVSEVGFRVCRRLFEDFVAHGKGELDGISWDFTGLKRNRLAGLISGDAHYDNWCVKCGVRNICRQGFGDINMRSELPHENGAVHRRIDLGTDTCIDVVAVKPSTGELAIFRVGAGNESADLIFEKGE